MKFVLLSCLVFLSTNVFANNTCLNKAMGFAGNAYFSEMGTIQGSEGPEFSGTFLKQSGNRLTYKIFIFDNNEDGETWTSKYLVVVDYKNKKCQKVSVENIGVETDIVD